ncbi:MAG TPA: transcriptional repressor [Armatimonadetes bacterium]|nr:transcriptional repressor [Armatimonadota bacterium]
MTTLHAKLKKAGFRLTRPRRLVIDILRSHEGTHLSAEEVHQRLTAAGESISLASVYRTLNLLAELGLIHGASLREVHAHFEIQHEAEVHLICKRCGQVSEAGLPTTQGFAELLFGLSTGEGFAVEGFQLEIYGLCERCQMEGN